MFNRINEDRLNPDPLPARLRALPAFTPPAGGWARLDARLSARRRNYAMAGGGFALAASVLVGVGLVGLRPESAPPPASQATVVATAPAAPRVSPAVTQLIQRSQALERELAAVRTQVAMWDTNRDTRAGLLEQELRRVDAQINFADTESAEQLWRYRVKLMNALVELHEPEAPALQYASYQY
ncbi:MAG: hypothetical protein ACT4PK_02255 [Gammaproteobacteria bacterium]